MFTPNSKPSLLVPLQHEDGGDLVHFHVPDVVCTNKYFSDLFKEGEDRHGLDLEPEAGALHLVHLVNVPEVPIFFCCFSP